MAIRYDDYVKRPNEELEYTPYQIEELMKCKDDILYFAQNYVKIVTLDHGEVIFDPYKYQLETIDLLNKNRFFVGLWARQSGKAESIDTPIAQPFGKWTTMGDIKVGDVILGKDGNPTKVTFATEIMNDHNCYEIEFDNQEKIIADKEHLWKIGSNRFRKRTKEGRIGHLEKVLTTEDIYNEFNKKYSYDSPLYINYHDGIKNKKINLPIDPYVLGCWLGDGTSIVDEITTNNEDYDEISTLIEKSYEISEFKKDKRKENTGKFTAYKLITDLKKINLNGNKHIPRIYFASSLYQRLELLRGLMDTDGSCCSNGSCEFYQKNHNLILQVRELLSSLGIKSRIRDKEVDGEIYYTISFTTRKFYVFNLKRKRELQKRCKNHPKNERIYIKNIRKVDSVPVRCIQVDNEDHLFLCSKTMIPTHNTTVVAIYALHYAIFNDDKNIGIVSNKESSAKRILDTMKRMYEGLPVWLKPGVTEYQKTSVHYENGTNLIISATTQDAFRGWPMNMVICDEFAFVPSNQAEEFWAANYPTISSSKKSKLIIISCVTDDTYIYSNKGVKQVKDFIKKDENGGYQINNYNILGKDKLNSGNLFVNSGIADTRIIKTTNSHLEGSLNHKLWGCKNGNYDWYKLSELDIGDYVALQYGKNIWGNNDTINFKSNKRKNKQGVSLEVNKITKDWAYLFGLYIAEGYADNYRLNISCGDDISFIYDRLGIKYTCNDGIHYVSSCLSLVELLKHVGFDVSRKAKQKEIPKKLLGMSKENIAAMLRGIFDGDGWSRQDKGFVGIGLSSKRLIKQIRILLMNFGILTDYQEVESKPTKKVKVKSIQYRLQCDKNSSRKFYELIGFNLERKQNNLCILNELNEFKEAKNSDLIPYSKDFLMKFKSLNTNSKFGIIKDIEKRIGKHIYNRGPNGHFSRALMLRIKNILDEIYNQEIKNFFDNNVSKNIKWCPIIEIKESKNEVYDFSLPDIENDPWCHSIIYNGYIGHQTPNGMFNIFHRIWTGAQAKNNYFTPYKVTWDKVPGRDKEWAKKEIANMGATAFNQEYSCHFLGSTNTVIHPECLRTLMNIKEDPLFYDLQDRLRLWEKPKEGARYILGTDPAKGTGENFSAIQILKLTSVTPVELVQVGVFEDNLTDVYEFAQIVNKLSYYYNDAYIMCENNGEGAAVITQLWNTFENENLVNSGSKIKSLGIRAQKDTKPKAVLLMKKLIEDGSIRLRDRETIEQLGSFIEENNKFFGKDKPDDLVSALYWGGYIFNMNILEDDWKFKDGHMDETDAWGILSDIEDDIDDWSWLTKSTIWE